MVVQFSDLIVDKHIAPGVSLFTEANIPNMATYAKESSHWVANYFLNSLTASFAPPMNAYAYNFIRRTQFAFLEHANARESTLAFLMRGRQSPSRYAEALFHWECFLGQAWHAFAILVKAWQGRTFSKNDGSMEQRLNAMYNQVKHVESRIENGQMIAGATVPVWICNDGLRSIDTTLSYSETASVLQELAMYADALSNPRTAKQVLSAFDGT